MPVFLGAPSVTSPRAVTASVTPSSPRGSTRRSSSSMSSGGGGRGGRGGRGGGRGGRGNMQQQRQQYSYQEAPEYERSSAGGYTNPPAGDVYTQQPRQYQQRRAQPQYQQQQEQQQYQMQQQPQNQMQQAQQYQPMPQQYQQAQYQQYQQQPQQQYHSEGLPQKRGHGSDDPYASDQARVATARALEGLSAGGQRGGQVAERPQSAYPAPQQQGRQQQARPASAAPPQQSRQGGPSAQVEGRGGKKRGQGGRGQAGDSNAQAFAPPPDRHTGGSAPEDGGGAAQNAPRANPAPINKTALEHQSQTRFADLEVSPLTKQAMATVFGYEFCTNVQAKSLPACLSGQDVLAKAKTGTGKTIAFMIPVIEQLLRNPSPQGQVGAIVLSPTRELASQIHVEAEKLVKFHKFSVQVVVGGTNIKSEARAMKSRTPDILVATPGRLLDHMTTSGLQDYVKGLRVLVADEADSLLDMGFRPTLDKILKFLPPRDQRQSLLFSATFPKDVKSLADYALRKPFATVDCVGEQTGTNVQVKQYKAVVPHAQLMPTLYLAIKEHMDADRDSKVIVFFPTARTTQIMSEMFQAIGIPVLEMHSRKSQGHRTKMSDQFRNNDGVIMFSSDVSARGVDYPDVSMVIQVGLPSDKAQYVHRVGRTARAGKEGVGLLLLADFEGVFVNKLEDLPVETKAPYPAPALDQATALLNRGLTKVPADSKGKAYQAWLGFYNSAGVLSLSKPHLVQLGNEFAALLGCPEPPELDARTVGKMGIKGTPGLRVAKGPSGREGGGGGRGRGGGGGGGDGR